MREVHTLKTQEEYMFRHKVLSIILNVLFQTFFMKTWKKNINIIPLNAKNYNYPAEQCFYKKKVLSHTILTVEP